MRQNPKTPIKDKKYHKCDQFSLLTQTLSFRLCALSHKNGHLVLCLTLFLQVIKRADAAYFSQEKEKKVFYEEYKKYRIADSSTVAASRQREIL